MLRGQPESSWIDAKVEPHRVDGEASGIELGKDVAAFANTGADAIIVWGMKTAKAPRGSDVLDAVRPFELSGVDVEALRNALAARLVPLLTDIDIQVVDVREGTGYGLGWIFVPAQPGHVRPVLVRGALEAKRCWAATTACRSGSERTRVTGTRRRSIRRSRPVGWRCSESTDRSPSLGRLKRADRPQKPQVLPTAASRAHRHPTGPDDRDILGLRRSLRGFLGAGVAFR